MALSKKLKDVMEAIIEKLYSSGEYMCQDPTSLEKNAIALLIQYGAVKKI